jgi:hypothetical protein
MGEKSLLGSLATLDFKSVATATIAPLDYGKIDHSTANKNQQQHRDSGQHLGGGKGQLRH